MAILMCALLEEPLPSSSSSSSSPPSEPLPLSLPLSLSGPSRLPITGRRLYTSWLPLFTRRTLNSNVAVASDSTTKPPTILTLPLGTNTSTSWPSTMAATASTSSSSLS